MNRISLYRLCSLIALALALSCFGLATQAQQTPDVTIKPVKYAELTKLIRQNSGHVVLVDFWRDTCIPCKKKFPHLVEMNDRYKSQGLTVISVSVDPDPQKKETQDTALRFLQDRKATFTNLILDEPEQFWTEKLGIELLPCVYVFNRDGKWRKFTGDEAKIEDIEKLVVDWLKTN